MDAAGRVLQDKFGFKQFREGQRAVIGRLLAGRSAVAVFPTGAGKSLCYQLPALLLDGLTVVVSPLIALMKDQLDFLTARGIAAARLDSTLEPGEERAVLSAVRAGALKLLYVAPERFASERFRTVLKWQGPSLLAVDEAHCISEWGHNFRPDYLKLAGVAREIGVPRVLALTATATPAVTRDIAASFGVPADDVVRTGFHRPNLWLEASACRAGERVERLVERLAARGPQPAIVYTTLQRTAEELAEHLRFRGFPARAYHAGLETPERTRVQDWFMRAPDGIVCATIAFGMGVDKPDIRAVYHFNLPRSLESYAQETGRAGRDGQPAWCELFACADDRITLENFVYGATPDRASLSGLVGEVLRPGAPDEIVIAPHELAARHDLRPLVLDTALAYLEGAGLLRATGAFHAEYQLRFPGARPVVAEPLARALGSAREGRRWLSLDVSAALAASGLSRAALLAQLAELEQRGAVVLEPAGRRRSYRRPGPPGGAPAALEAVVEELHARFHESEARDVARVAQAAALATAPGCTTRQLVAYFGDPPADCGHCGRCAGRAPAPRLPGVEEPVRPGERRTVHDLVTEGHRALARPRQLARFLCGLASPATTRARLARDRRYGMLARRRFPEVLAVAEAALSSAAKAA